MNKLLVLHKYLKSSGFTSEASKLSFIIKESILSFQCSFHSMGWLDSESNFHLLPPSGNGAMSHESWIEKNLGVDYSDWKESNDSKGWIKVSSSDQCYSFGREFNSLDRLEVAKLFLNCLLNPNYLSNIKYQLKKGEGDFIFSIIDSNGRFPSSKISYFDFFDKISRESELGSKLSDIFYNIIDDENENKSISNYLSEEQIESFIHQLPEDQILSDNGEISFDEVEFFKKKEVIPKHIFNRHAGRVVENMSPDAFFYSASHIPSDLYNSNVEKKALELSPDDFFFYYYQNEKLPENIFNMFAFEKGVGLEDWQLDGYREYMPEELYSKIKNAMKGEEV